VTKYILAGGNDRDYIEYGRNLATEVRKTLKGELTILSCFFSQPHERWSELATGFEAWFRDNFGDDIRYMAAKEKDFPEQIKQASVVYLHGGDDGLLIHKLRNYPEIAKHFKDKIVIGSSAGSICLGERSWSCDSRTVIRGLGLVPANTIVHFDSDYAEKRGRATIDWIQAEQELRADVGPNAPISVLREGQFEVFEV
jgi:peptidase E